MTVKISLAKTQAQVPTHTRPWKIKTDKFRILSFLGGGVLVSLNQFKKI